MLCESYKSLFENISEQEAYCNPAKRHNSGGGSIEGTTIDPLIRKLLKNGKS